MARPKRAIPSQAKTVYIPLDVAGQVDLLLYSELEGRVPFGKWSELVTELLREYLQKQRSGKQGENHE